MSAIQTPIAGPRLRTLDELAVTGRRVLLRADLDVPLSADGEIAEDDAIRAALPTLQELRDRGARVVLAATLGRPVERDPALSMAPVAERVATLTAAPVILAPAVVGAEVRELTKLLRRGEVLVLENLDYEPAEARNDAGFARALAELADAYVDDAFGAAHEARASTDGVARLLPAAAGLLLEHELAALPAPAELPGVQALLIAG